MKILVTGCAGFIGFHLTKKLLEKNYKVFGVDNLSKYYDVKLKNSRIRILSKFKNFSFKKKDITETSLLNFYESKNIKIIIHLAAQAGVRYSLQNPRTYIDTNLVGSFNILELSKKLKLKHLLMASSSSVYGNSKKFPLKENFNTDHPSSLYAATKKSTEVISYTYSKNFKVPITCLRFFTVYGPFSRPDMSLFKFTNSMLKNKSIELYNYGIHARDFTFIDDAVDMVIKIIKKPPKESVPFNVLNIANSKPIKLLNYIKLLEKILRLKAKFKKLPLQKGDVFKTHGSNINIIKKIGRHKFVKIEEGLSLFVEWYKKYYNI
tara:strand:- start:98 stop:1060 length:963 start_codon:yes stop_codon:yes gene_type:complete